jgi:tryptophanase
MKHKTIIEPFRIKMVEPITMSTQEERIQYLKDAHFNTFLLDSEKVLIDFLTDSGTSAMSAGQWAGIMNGDESYAGARSWKHMESTVKDLTGFDFVIPTHQGRAAESILYGHLGGKGKYFISNTLFDTTRANIEFGGAEGIDCLIPEGKQPAFDHPFKGNMNIAELERIVKEKGPENIGAVVLTVTNNSGGGQPVSMQNAKEVRRICDEYNLMFVLDCCRIAENSYFVHHREEEYSNMSYRDIAKEMFRLADGAIMSAKKDAMVNIGGFMVMNDPGLMEACSNLLIIKEGFVTYGGLAGRDMEAIAIGLKEVFHEDYLHYRIMSTFYLGEKLKNLGVPIMTPVGGHAVYVDAKELYSHIPVHQYPGQVLVAELYKLGGIRTVEIGSVMFGKYGADGELIPAPMELVRLAIPRRVYTQSHIDYVVETFKAIMEEKDEVRGYKIVKEPQYLRHFTAHFELIQEASSNS